MTYDTDTIYDAQDKLARLRTSYRGYYFTQDLEDYGDCRKWHHYAVSLMGKPTLFLQGPSYDPEPLNRANWTAQVDKALTEPKADAFDYLVRIMHWCRDHDRKRLEAYVKAARVMRGRPNADPLLISLITTFEQCLEPTT